MKAFKVIFVLLIFFVSCEKPDSKNNFIGTWQLIGTGGGIFGQGRTANFNFLILTPQDQYQFTQDNTLIENGTYKVSQHNKPEYLGTGNYKLSLIKSYQLEYGAQISTPDLIIQEISRDTIGLYETFADGFSYYFCRSLK